jgi:AmmeMemoRadiSam system protein A
MSLTKGNQQRLLNLTKKSIQQGLKTGQPLKINLADFPPELTEYRATFVTLQIDNQLRGCIGMLEAVRPLVEDIAENAFSAAFKDPRFPPLSKEEFDKLEIHLSILTPSEQIIFESEQDLIAQLRPNIDGLILEEGHRRGTFLPSVWEQLPDPKVFIRHLKQKAGLKADYWSASIKVYRYKTEMIT